MKIGLNLLPVVPGVGGSWQYVSSLLAALAEHDHENSYVAFVTSASAPLVPAAANFKAVTLPVHAPWRPLRVAFENSVFRLVTGRVQLDCIHHLFGSLPLFTHLPSVVTVHDLMVFARPADFSPIKRAYLQNMERRTAARATVVAPVSKSTGEDLHRLLAVPWHRMQVVPAALNTNFARASPADVERFRTAHKLPPNFWLCVSGAYPHKNYRRLLTAFAALRRDDPTGWPLVIRGDSVDVIRAMVAELQLDQRVLLLPRLADDDMPLLYSAASALVFPSLFEGGGIPVMEAMACGCPVVASDIPTTREFAGNGAVRFDPASVDAIRDAMARCELSDGTRAKLRAAGFAASRQFDPDIVARACMTAYAHAVNG